MQLKGLRKILKLNTTYVNRANTNERVIALADNKIKEINPSKTILLFSEVYHRLKLALYQELLSRPEEDPVRQSTFDAVTLSDKRFEKNRVGRPRLKLNSVTAAEYWQATRAHRTYPLNVAPLDLTKPEHRAALLATAARKPYTTKYTST